jgi:hypothetical protein
LQLFCDCEVTLAEDTRRPYLGRISSMPYGRSYCLGTLRVLPLFRRAASSLTFAMADADKQCTVAPTTPCARPFPVGASRVV